MDGIPRRRSFGPLAVLVAVCTLGATLVVGAVGPGVASASGSGWSSTTVFDPGHGVDSISCPTPTFCLAVDSRDSLVYDGTSWSAPEAISGATALTSVSCTSASFCAALDFYGDAFTYDGSSWSEPTPIHTYDPSTGDALLSVSCVSSTFCMAISIGGYAMTYDGTSWSPSVAIDELDRGPRGADLLSVSCPSTSFCVAVDGAGNAMTYDGSSWSPPTTIDAMDSDSGTMIAVSCPSTSFCMALSRDGYVLTWDGASWSDPVAVGLSPSEGSLDYLSCGSSTFCIALDEGGQISRLVRLRRVDLVDDRPLPGQPPRGRDLLCDRLLLCRQRQRRPVELRHDLRCPALDPDRDPGSVPPPRSRRPGHLLGRGEQRILAGPHRLDHHLGRPGGKLRHPLAQRRGRSVRHHRRCCLRALHRLGRLLGRRHRQPGDGDDHRVRQRGLGWDRLQCHGRGDGHGLGWHRRHRHRHDRSLRQRPGGPLGLHHRGRLLRPGALVRQHLCQ